MKLPAFLSKLTFTRKQSIIGGVAVFLAFGGALGLSIFLTPRPAKQDPNDPQSQVKGDPLLADKDSQKATLERLTLPEAAVLQLQEEYKKKLAKLEDERQLLTAREERIVVSQKSLDGQAQALQDEAVRLEAAEKRVRQAIMDLRRTRVEFTRQEKLAMQKQAEFLEAMAPEQAAAAIQGLLEQGSMKNALLALQSMDSKKAGRALAAMTNAKYQALLLEKLPKLMEAQEQGP
jgi:hypothetical protein